VNTTPVLGPVLDNIRRRGYQVAWASVAGVPGETAAHYRHVDNHPAGCDVVRSAIAAARLVDAQAPAGTPWNVVLGFGLARRGDGDPAGATVATVFTGTDEGRPFWQRLDTAIAVALADALAPLPQV